MGCFSYMCPKCSKQIYSDKYGNCIGEEVRLARIVKGKVVEWMKGRYNSYGGVHIGKDSKHYIGAKRVNDDDNKSKYHGWKSADWGDMIDEHFSNDESEGMVAIHEKCWDGKFSKTCSKDDPNQGWKDIESEGDFHG